MNLVHLRNTTMRHFINSLSVAILLGAGPVSEVSAQFGGEVYAPIRVVTKLRGQMTNTVTGIGIVTGLKKGTGDRASRRAMANMIRKYDLNVDETMLTSGSFTLVTVTAELPSSAKEGRTIDVQVQSISTPDSLNAGYLQKVLLSYDDGMNHIPFVEASGTIGASINEGGKDASVTVNHPWAGVITNGGRVIEDIEAPLMNEAGDIELILLNPSIKTAFNIAAAINAEAKELEAVAKVHDESMVVVKLPAKSQNRSGALKLLYTIGEVGVACAAPINIIINQGTGTIIAGAGVQINPCVVSKSDITVSVVEVNEVSQPLAPFTRSDAKRYSNTQIDLEYNNSPDGATALRGGGATVDELLNNLKALKLPPRALVDVFRELSFGGYLHAPLIVR